MHADAPPTRCSLQWPSTPCSYTLLIPRFRMEPGLEYWPDGGPVPRDMVTNVDGVPSCTELSSADPRCRLLRYETQHESWYCSNRSSALLTDYDTSQICDWLSSPKPKPAIDIRPLFPRCSRTLTVSPLCLTCLEMRGVSRRPGLYNR